MNQLIFVFISSFSFLIGNIVGLKTESIIGGVLAKENQFPYMVSLQLDNTCICGGALIAPDLVLTAAHCVTINGQIIRLPFTVIGGIIDSSSDIGTRINISKIYVHNKFIPLTESNQTSVNDIAVLRLTRNFNVNESTSIGLIDLTNDENDTFVGKTAIITGFGWITVHNTYNVLDGTVERIGRSDNKLNFAIVKIVNNLECGNPNSLVLCGRIIPHHRYYVRGVCDGDSGAPLVRGNKVIGIGSYSGIECNERRKPSVYTRVSSFLNFIKGAMKDEPTNDSTVGTI